MKILAISGSLRARPSNTELLRAAARRAAVVDLRSLRRRSVVDIVRSVPASASCAITVAEASIVVALDGRRLDAAGIAADPALASLLRGALDALVRVALSREP